MSLEPTIALPAAARLVGVSTKTLRQWLRVDLGIVFPDIKRGASRLVRRIDVETVQRLHSGQKDFGVMRAHGRTKARRIA